MIVLVTMIVITQSILKQIYVQILLSKVDFMPNHLQLIIFSFLKKLVLKYFNLIKMINQSQQILSNENTSGLSNRKSVEQQRRRLLNVGGVLNEPHFMLVALLVIVTISSVWVQTDEIRLHERYLRMYFNLNILGMDNQGFYEDADNIDQSETEIMTFDSMRTMLKELANVTNTYHQDGLVLFELDEQGTELIRLNFQYFNDSFDSLVFTTADDTLNYFEGFDTNFTRDFLLNIQWLKFTTKLGSNSFVNNYEIRATFTSHHRLILQANFQYSYDQTKSSIDKKIKALRMLEQIIAAINVLIFVYRLTVLKNAQLQLTVINSQDRRRYYQKWLFFLSLMNIIVFFSQKYAPMAACLQLLPLFQFPEQDQKAEHQIYNFNKNIRFSFSLILTIWIPLILCLNGFIYYSMLMYANSDQGYFSSYFYAFCDYIYNMFQCGTNQIFVEMQMYGPIAQVLYAFLYFYAFQVGTALIPAFFCTLIQLKINERDIADHSANLIKRAVCPNCKVCNNYKLDSPSLQILVSSPRLTPLVKQKKLVFSPQRNGKSLQSPQQVILQIEHDEQEAVSLGNKYKLSEKFLGYSKRLQSLVRQVHNYVSQQQDEYELLKMKQAVERYRQEQI